MDAEKKTREYLVYKLTQMAESGPLGFDAETIREAARALESAGQGEALLTNPHTGTPRDYRDVESDPNGILIHKAGEPLQAAPQQPAAVPVRVSWADFWIAQGDWPTANDYAAFEKAEQWLLAQQPAVVGVEAVRGAWLAAITLANNICVQESDRENDRDGDTGWINGTAECAKRIREYAHPTDADLLEMLDEAGANAAKAALAQQPASKEAEIEALRAEVDALRGVLKELITWIPSADTYRRLGFDHEAPMRALGAAQAALSKENKA